MRGANTTAVTGQAMKSAFLRQRISQVKYHIRDRASSSIKVP